MVNRLLGSGDEEAFHLLAGFSGRDDGGSDADNGGSGARGAVGFVKPTLLDRFINLISGEESLFGNPDERTPDRLPD